MSTQDAAGVRRIVTRCDENGKSVVWIDSRLERRTPTDENVSSTVMWSTDRSPTELLSSEDEGQRKLGTTPPASGSRFTMMEFQPGNKMHGLHRTDTVDYVICIAGEIDMFLDETNFVHLEAGDVLIQRGTDHSWVNRGTVPCRLAVVLLDAVPKREGSLSGAQRAR
jgi:oxalate decarboxylase/phosphoglucose isomerase-like protein (cupin superfamily)